jgi:TPR repeat protein
MRRLLQAAQKGDADAQFNLGVLYENRPNSGEPVGGNRMEAVKWLLEASQQGLPRAQIKLAELYADGHEGPDGYAKACFWFLLATPSLSGIHRERAQAGYARVAAQLTPAEIANAMTLARTWEPSAQNAAAIAPSRRAPQRRSAK